MSSLYLHIPFCEHKCIYCDFYSLVPAGSPQEHHSTIDRFLRGLETEIQMRGEDSRYREPVETIFFGGRTPSLLHPSEMEKILHLLASQFSIAEDAEITLETNPGTVDKKKLTEYRSAGINRLSIGIQSFHDDDLKFLTRIHSAAEAKQCVRDAFAAGFQNVSFDLIFSLPGQTLQRWASNLEQALGLHPQHISCYSLIVEPETPLFRMVQTKEVALLDVDADAELYEYTIHTLTNHGFEHYEISNFAKPGYSCRHNINYWNHTHYLGFGPSAHSFWDKERWWNVSDIGTYVTQLETAAFPLGGGEHLTEAQMMEEALFLGLRSGGVDLEHFRRRFGCDLLVEHAPTISEIIQQGNAQIVHGRLRLTSKGYVVCDAICQMFH